MKKRIFLTALASICLLASCNSSSGSPSDYAKMIIANNNQADYVETTYSQNYATVDLNLEEYQSVVNLGMGLLAITTEEGYVGFFSLSYQDYLIQPQFIPEYLSYQIYECSVGFYLKLEYRDNLYYYDSMGNSLLSIAYSTSNNTYTLNVYGMLISTSTIKPEIFQIDGNDFSFTEIDGENGQETYVVCRIGSSEYHYGIYDRNTGSIQTLSTNPLIGIVESAYVVGDTYVDTGYTDLSNYGMASGYYLYRSTNNYFAVMKDGILVSSFTLPEYDQMAIFDGKILYQYSTILPDDATSYDYFTSEYNSSTGDYETTKYSLTTCSLDLITGNSLEIIVSYVMESLTSFRNQDEIYVYGSAQARSILSNGALNSLVETYILTSSGYVYYNATNKSASDIVKLDDEHYYDTSKKILYDSNLNVISFLSGVNNVSIDRAGELLIGQINGYYGAMDYDLKVVIPFQYETSFTLCEDGYTMAMKDDIYYRISLDDGSTTEIGEVSLNRIADGCYYYSQEVTTNDEETGSTTTSYSFDFLSSSKYLTEEVTVSENSIITSDVSCSINDSAYAFAILRDSRDDGVHYLAYAFYSTAFPNASSFSSTVNGNERTATYSIGETYSESVSLNISSLNLLTITSTSGNYFSLILSNTSTYSFSFNKEANVNIYTLESSIDEETSLEITSLVSQYSASSIKSCSYSPTVGQTYYLLVSDPNFGSQDFSNYTLSISVTIRN